MGRKLCSTLLPWSVHQSQSLSDVDQFKHQGRVLLLTLIIKLVVCYCFYLLYNRIQVFATSWDISVSRYIPHYLIENGIYFLKVCYFIVSSHFSGK